jgi:hypothetical protein
MAAFLYIEENAGALRGSNKKIWDWRENLSSALIIESTASLSRSSLHYLQLKIITRLPTHLKQSNKDFQSLEIYIAIAKISQLNVLGEPR